MHVYGGELLLLPHGTRVTETEGMDVADLIDRSGGEPRA